MLRTARQKRYAHHKGGVVGRMPGRMMWLASWLKVGNRYTLEQMRANLPEAMRFDLGYRDAIAIAFFAAYMLPQMNGLLVGFGTGSIFRRLNREAPMGAIRRSIRDTMVPARTACAHPDSGLFRRPHARGRCPRQRPRP